jgi:di/tricarboxylate transporter
MAFGLPTGLALFIIIWAYLCCAYLKGFSRYATKDNQDEQESQSNCTDDGMLKTFLFKDQYIALGDWSWEEESATFWFLLLCVLWFFGADFDFGSFVLASILGGYNIFDSTSGMLVVFILFIWPARSSFLERIASNTKDPTTSDATDCEEGLETIPLLDDPNSSTTEQNNDENNDSNDIKKGIETGITNMITLVKECDTTLLDWKTVNKMHYDIVFLLGGGFALAQAFQTSGLVSQTLGEALAGIHMPLLAMVSILTFMFVWLTELTSNSSTANIMIPIAAAMAVSLRVSHYTYMIPATLACSCAFALPIATPPNTIAFSTGKLPIKEMNKAGLFLNIVSVLVIVAVTFTIVPAVLGVPVDSFPEWANTTNSTNIM